MNSNKKIFYTNPSSIYKITVEKIAQIIKGFDLDRKNFKSENVGSGIKRKLYATYLTYLPKKSFAYNIKVQNNRLDAINVVIHDQIPVSTNNQIHVELYEKTDGIHQLDEGLIIWNKIIETSKNAVVNIQYSVKYPKDLRINL